MYLNLENVSKVFPGRGTVENVTAVDNVSLTIEKGEFVTLLGPSGCGKTTTLRMVAGFEFPSSGAIQLDGAAIDRLPPHKRQMSMVFQSYAIFPHLSVFENVAYGLRVQRLGNSVINKRVETVLELVELHGYGDRAPNQLSGGQQQRVALARALVMEPKVLLMDEPLSNLDAKLREQMRNEIRGIQQMLGITSIYVTHDQVEAMTMSDRIVVMNEGRIEQVGTPPEIYRTPRNRFVAGFIGRANFIPGTVTAVKGELVTVAVLGTEITMPAGLHALQNGQAVTLVVRPEMATINRGAPHARGIVRRSTFLGDNLEYEIDIADERLLLVENDPRHLALYPDGEEVTVHFLEECLYPLPEVVAA